MLEPKVIPGFGRYGITRDGRIFNYLTGKFLKTSPDPRGYHRTILVNNQGVRKGVKRHRLVALTHLEWPASNIEDYVVNHKDLTPGNDWVENLEWCSQKHNVEHWVKNGIERSPIPLETLDGEDGKLTQYETIAECSKDLGIERYSIQLRLERGPEYVWPEGKRYRLGHSDHAWPKVKYLKYGRAKEVMVKDLKNGQLTIFSKLSDVLSVIGTKLGSAWKWADDPHQPVLPGFVQLQFLDNLKPWREVGDVFEELQQTTKGKIVCVFDSEWCNPVWYLSAKKCADTHGLKPTALNYRLKSKGEKVYSDNKRYCYYDDLTIDQKKTIRYEVSQH